MAIAKHNKSLNKKEATSSVFQWPSVMAPATSLQLQSMSRVTYSIMSQEASKEQGNGFA